MSSPSSLHNAVAVNISNSNFDAFYSSVLLSARTKGKTYLLLEGPNDAKVLKYLFDVKIISIPCIGRGNVVKVFKKLPRIFTNIFGIADRDYDLTPFVDPRLFYYDGNNFEMMLVKDDDAFRDPSLFKSYIEGASFDSNDLINIRDNVFLHLLPISIFRKINMQIIPEHKRLAVSTVYPNLYLCMSETKSDVVATIKNNILVNLCDVEPNILNCIISSYDSELEYVSIEYCDVTQGHDFVELFKRETGIILDSDFYNIFKKAYTKNLFVKTVLYKNLSKYALFQTIKMFPN